MGQYFLDVLSRLIQLVLLSPPQENFFPARKMNLQQQLKDIPQESTSTMRQRKVTHLRDEKKTFNRKKTPPTKEISNVSTKSSATSKTKKLVISLYSSEIVFSLCQSVGWAKPKPLAKPASVIIFLLPRSEGEKFFCGFLGEINSSKTSRVSRGKENATAGVD